MEDFFHFDKLTQAMTDWTATRKEELAPSSDDADKSHCDLEKKVILNVNALKPCGYFF